jgi:hypothetical protein
MNKRIKELVKQAGLEFDNDSALESEPIYYITQKDLEKFAELIVRECISQIENLSPGYEDYRNQIEDAFRRDCVDQLKQHFGVEE